MDKLTRTVAIMIAVAIAACAVLLAFFLTRPSAQRDTPAVPLDTDEKATLLSPGMEHVQAMHITNRHGAYTLVPVDDKEQETLYYTVQGVDFAQIDVQAVQEIVKYGCNPVSTGSIGYVNDLSAYGLDTPAATVSVLYANGETYDYHIGRQVAGTSGRYYMCAKGSRNVYMVMAAPAMLGAAENLYTQTSCSMSGEDGVSGTAEAAGMLA